MKPLLFTFLAFSSVLISQENLCESSECCFFVYPSCRFESDCGFNTYLTFEGLYWIAKENGLIIAQEGVPAPGAQTDTIPPSSFNFCGKVLRIDPNLDWGFRLNLGYNFCYDEWDLKASWTSYRTENTTKFRSDGSSFALNLWGHPDVSSSSASSLIRAHFDFTYDTVDLEWARAFAPGQYFCLRPYFGVRASRIDQTLNNFNQVAFIEGTDQSLSLNLEALSNFVGIGPRFGFDGRFDLMCDLSFYTTAGYNILYGSFDASFKESISGDNPTSSLPNVKNLKIADAQDCFHMGTSSLQLGLGLQWNRGFCCNRYRLGFNISWEQNLWFQLNQMNHFQSKFSEGILFQENGNLYLQGISFGGRFDF